MLPYTSRGVHQEKSRRFLEEVNRDVRGHESSENSDRFIDRMTQKVGSYLIDIGRALAQRSRTDP